MLAGALYSGNKYVQVAQKYPSDADDDESTTSTVQIYKRSSRFKTKERRRTLVFKIFLCLVCSAILLNKVRSRYNNSTEESTSAGSAIITMSIRTKWTDVSPAYSNEPEFQYLQGCTTRRFQRIQEYAESVGADFFNITSMEHDAFITVKRNMELEIYFAKFYVLYFYLLKYDHVLWFDDTILINSKCDCMPDLFQLSKSHFAAAKDIARSFHELAEYKINKKLCNVTQKSSELFEAYESYCDNINPEDFSEFNMFNSGVMVFHKEKHMFLFEEFINIWQWEITESQRAIYDQGMFQFLIKANKLTWVDLDSPENLVVGGYMLLKHYRGKGELVVKNEKFLNCIGHVTRGAKHTREEWLCNDWDWCTADYDASNVCILPLGGLQFGPAELYEPGGIWEKVEARKRALNGTAKYNGTAQCSLNSEAIRTEFWDLD